MADQSTIKELLLSLGSSRIKPRTDAVASLRSMLAEPPNLSVKDISSLISGLILNLKLEKDLFERHASNLVEDRIHDATLIIRKLVALRPGELKFKCVKSLLQFISKFILQECESLQPLNQTILLNLSIVLETLLSITSHRDHIKSSDWNDLTLKLIRVLDIQFQNSKDKLALEIVSSLRSLLKSPPSNLDKVSSSYKDLIANYFDSLRRENSSTHLMIEIANDFMVLNSLENIDFCKQICYSIISTGSIMINSNQKSIKDQLLIFTNIAYEFLSDQSENYSVDYDKITLFTEALLDWILKSEKISIFDIEFTNFTGSSVVKNDKSWFEFDYFRIKENSEQRPWLLLLGLTKVCIKCLGFQEGFKASLLPAKRRKPEIPYGADLYGFDEDGDVVDPDQRHEKRTSLLESLLYDRKNKSKNLIGIQFLIFASKLYSSKIHNDKFDQNIFTSHTEHLIKLSQVKSLKPWVLLLFKCWIENGLQIPESIQIQLIKNSITSLKEKDSVSVSAQLLIQVLIHPKIEINDRSLVQQFESNFLMPNNEGPITLNNDTMKFWVAISRYGVPISNRTSQIIGDSIYKWIDSKWTDLIEERYISYFSELIKFLILGEFDLKENKIPYYRDNFFYKYYLKWERQLQYIRISEILGVSKPPLELNLKSSVNKLPVESQCVFPLIKKFKAIYDEFGAELTNFKFYQLGGLLLELCGPIMKAIPDKTPFIKESFISLIVLREVSEYNEMIEIVKLLSTYNINQQNDFILKNFNIELFIDQLVDQTYMLESSSDIAEEFEGFGEVRKNMEKNRSSSHHENSYDTLVLGNSGVQMAVQTLLVLHPNAADRLNLTKSLSAILKFLSGLNTRQIFEGLYTLINFIENSKYFNTIPPELFFDVLRLMGERLLSRYEFESSPSTTILALRFLALIIESSELKRGDSLSNDMADVFQWAMDYLKKLERPDELVEAFFVKLLVSSLKLKQTSFIDPSVDVKTLLLNSINGSGNFVKYHSTPLLVDFITHNSESYNKKLDFCEKVLSSFGSPDDNKERSRSWFYMNTFLSKTSYSSFVQSLKYCFEFYDSEHCQESAVLSYRKILTEKEIPQTLKNEELLKLELFKYWQPKDLRKFPFRLLQYPSVKDFFKNEFYYIYAVDHSCLNRIDNFEIIIKEQFYEYNGDVDPTLQTISLLIPLSFTHGGLNYDMEQELIDEYDESIIDDQLFLIVYRLIQFCDLSNPNCFQKYISNFGNIKYVSALLPDDTTQIYKPKETSIEFSLAITLMTKILKKKDIWTIGVIKFFLFNFFNGIDHARSIDQKLASMRRIKLLMILAGDNFANIDILSCFLKHLILYIKDPVIHSHISSFIITVLEIVCHKSIQLNDGEMVLEMFYEAGLFQTQIGSLNEELKTTLCDMATELQLEMNCKLLALSMRDFLKQGFINMDFSVINSFLNHAANVPGQKLKNIIYKILSLQLHENKKEFELIIACLRLNNVEISQAAARSLVNTEFCEFSEEFNLLKAEYLGKYYLETGDQLREEKVEFQPTIEYEIDKKSSNLHVVMDELIKRRKETESAEEALSIESILGFLYFKYNLDPESVSILVDFDAHIRPIANTLIPINEFTSGLIDEFNFYLRLKSDISQNINEHRIAVTQILNNLRGNDDYLFRKLISHVNKFPEVSKKILAPLLLFMTRLGNFKLVETFLKEHLHHDGELLKTTLNFISLTTAGYHKGIKEFIYLFNHYPTSQLLVAALKSGFEKLSLLTYESIKSANPEAQEQTICKYEDFLDTLYNSFEDIDMVHSLVRNTLEYSVRILNRTRTSPWERTMFNSALYDCSLMTLAEKATISRGLMVSPTNKMLEKTMVDSLASMSLSGVSKAVSNAARWEENSLSAYSWCWKLDQWDIPLPSEITTENELVYSILHMKQQGMMQNERIKALKMLTIAVVKNNKNEEYMKMLGILSTATQLFGFNTTEISPSVPEYKWFESSSFEDFDNLLLTRRIISENLGSFNTNFRSNISVLHSRDKHVNMAIEDIRRQYIVAKEMLRYGTLARAHGEKQHAINNTAYFGKVLRDEDAYSIINISSKFDTACTLWETGEINIPISMLRELVNPKVPNIFRENPDLVEVIQVSEVYAKLVKWCSESKQETFEDISSKYVNKALEYIDKVASTEKTTEIYHTLAYFYYKQTRVNESDEDFKRRKKLISNKEEELHVIRRILREPNLTENEKKEKRRYYAVIKAQLEQDSNEFELLNRNRKICIEKAVELFLKTLITSDLYDDEDVDKFCALWLEYSDNEVINELIEKEIKLLPMRKFVPWINQLVSRLSDDNTGFQRALQILVKLIIYYHPYHSAYNIMNLRLFGDVSSKADSTIYSRKVTADKIWRQFASENEAFFRKYLKPIEQICVGAEMLASRKTLGRESFDLKNLNIGTFWLKKLPLLNVPLPTMNNLPVMSDCQYDGVPKINSIFSVVDVSATGLSAPKIAKFQLTDGSVHKMLLKGGTDDLRQDAIMEQVFEKVNLILKQDKETRKRNLKIRTYKVVPLGPKAGLLEFVANSVALADILKPLHLHDKLSLNEAKKMMRDAQTKSSSERIEVYRAITSVIKPKFRNYFYRKFLTPNEWYESRCCYTRGAATTSMVGYILGLGDRHLSNILIDEVTGEPIHIDFGVAFDQGRLLPVPELVPFRLSRDIVDGFGVSGTAGLFQKGCEHVYRVLRGDVERIIGILDVLKYDPLYTWAISPIRLQKLQAVGEEDESITPTKIVKLEGESSDAVRAIKGVEDKLVGNKLNVEASVGTLIREATKNENLAVIFMGWVPFY